MKLDSEDSHLKESSLRSKPPASLEKVPRTTTPGSRGWEPLVGNLSLPQPLATVSPTNGCPNTCESLWKPVCGSDGRNYVNRCYLLSSACAGGAASALKELHEGPCCHRKCPLERSPVCDSLGRTHASPCELGVARCRALRLEAKGLRLASFGVCPQSPCSREACGAKYEPVCGSDSRTYINACELRKAACLAAESGSAPPLSLRHEGPCCVEDCPLEYQPVCDDQGGTHVNPCALRLATCRAAREGRSLGLAHPGPCCSQPCTADIAPLCDGRDTHPNLCLFKVAQCKAALSNRHLSVVHRGECCGRPAAGHCPGGPGPVCDADGLTHPNLCSFNYTQCVVRRQEGRQLRLLHDGECCPESSVCAGVTSEPVCDSRGQSHASLCLFNVARCRAQAIHPERAALTVQYTGRCCERDCGLETEPLCDQDGAMYHNRCRFEEAACRAQRSRGKRLLLTPCPRKRFSQMQRRAANLISG